MVQVPELKVRTGRPPKYSDSRASKAWFFGPVVIQPERSTSPTAAMVSSSMVGLEKGRKGSSAVMGIDRFVIGECAGVILSAAGRGAAQERASRTTPIMITPIASMRCGDTASPRNSQAPAAATT